METTAQAFWQELYFTMTVIHNHTVHKWKGNSYLINISIMTSQPQETMLLFKCPASVSGLICGGVAPASVSHIKRQLVRSGNII